MLHIYSYHIIVIAVHILLPTVSVLPQFFTHSTTPNKKKLFPLIHTNTKTIQDKLKSLPQNVKEQ